MLHGDSADVKHEGNMKDTNEFLNYDDFFRSRQHHGEEIVGHGVWCNNLRDR